MSRTGVGCRVMIDGALLQDGCTVWNPEPDVWTETRRNLFADPRATSLAVASWSSSGGAIIALSNITNYPGDIPTAVRSTRLATGNARVVDMVIGTTLPADTNVRLLLRVRSSQAMNSAAIVARPAVAVTSASVTIATLDIPAGESVVDVSGITHINAPTATAGFSIVHNGPPAGATLDVTGVLVALAPDEGGYFDGTTPDTQVIRHSWTAAANASPSVEESGSWSAGGYVGDGVSAASGLSIAWGRSTVVDQPVSSSCTLKIVDDPGGLTVLETIRIGSTLEVFADATLSGGIGLPAFTDPSFSTELRTTRTNATAARTQARSVDAGGWSALLTAVNSATMATVLFPPATLQTEGTNPAAWVEIPTTKPGETWTVRIKADIPSQVTVRLRPVFYSGPWASAAVVGTASVSVTGTGAGFVTMETTFSPGNSAQWVGFQLDISGGVAWSGMPDEVTWQSIGLDMSWGDLGNVYVDAVEILPPAGGTGTTVAVFSGRITDLEGYFDDDWSAPVMDVTASDFRADLGNRYIGDEPWSVETVTARMAHILSLAAIPGEDPVSIDIAPTIGNINLTLMDVDNRAADGMLTDIAQSVDGVLWSSSHPVIGPFMRLEDPAQRISLYQLNLVGGVITISTIDYTNVEQPPPSLSACDILRDPVNFTMSVSDIATRVDATYQEQPTPPATDTTERHVKRINSAQENVYGTRAVSIQTDLTNSTDTVRVAEQLIGRLSASWRIEGVVFADADVDVPDAVAARSLLTLLNAVTRGGQALLITDLDDWSPVGENAPVYLEGGKYEFVDGGWSLSLTVSRSAGFGTSVTWDQLKNDPAWIWDAWDQSLTWNELRGVAGPPVVAQRPEGLEPPKREPKG